MEAGTGMASTTFQRGVLIRQGRRLEHLTIGWNMLEAVVAIAAGWHAGSVALVGFGIDSIVEVSSGAALLWRLHQDHDESRRARVEGLTLRAVGVSFFLLAVYITWESLETLITAEAPERSLPGIVLTAFSIVVMPLLARAKRRVAKGIESRALEADAKQTDFCMYLSVIVLGGLLLNALFGWWWADPAAALVMVPIIAKEGRQAWQGKSCGCEDSCRLN